MLAMAEDATLSHAYWEGTRILHTYDIFCFGVSAWQMTDDFEVYSIAIFLYCDLSNMLK